MNMKTVAPKKKLVLAKETLKVLSADALSLVVGGEGTTGGGTNGPRTFTCASLVC